MTFQRARTDEQRDERRRTILTTTAEMLTEMPVAAVSLNEISRRVGLAKSNVLRYFDSREAILLDLLDAEMNAWADDLDAALADMVPSPTATATYRAAAFAGAVASTLEARPVTCDLISAQSAVLERNVSTEVILAHKHRTLALSGKVGGVIRGVLPELTDEDALQVTAALILLAASAWPNCTPTEAAEAAYDADPALAPLHMSFTEVLSRTLTLLITGLLAEQSIHPAP